MPVRDVKMARIFYRTDAGRTDAEEFQLGVLVFASNAGTHNQPAASLMLLMARQSLDENWASKMNPVARHLLERPAEFFKAEIDKAYKEGGSKDVLSILATKFMWSISISPPKEVTLPDDIGNLLEKIIKSEVRSKSATKVSTGKRKPALPKPPSDVELLAQLAGPALRDVVDIEDMPPAWMVDAVSAAAFHP